MRLATFLVTTPMGEAECSIIAACTDNGLGIAAVHPQALIMPLKVANFAGQARSAAVAAAMPETSALETFICSASS